jgi:hypothetical protein
MSAEIPRWWLLEMKKELATRGWEPVDLVQAIAGGKRGQAARFESIEVRVHRFLKSDKPTYTRETALEIGRALGLPDYVFLPESRTEAERLQAVVRQGPALAEAFLQKKLGDLVRQVAPGSVEEAEIFLAKISPRSGDTRDDE